MHSERPEQEPEERANRARSFRRGQRVEQRLEVLALGCPVVLWIVDEGRQAERFIHGSWETENEGEELPRRLAADSPSPQRVDGGRRVP